MCWWFLKSIFDDFEVFGTNNLIFNERYLFLYESNKVISKPKKVVLKQTDLKPKSKNKKILKKIKKSIDPNSPFAVLEKLL